MEKIIAEIAKEFIKRMMETVTTGETIVGIETSALRVAKESAAKIIAAYAEEVDAAITKDKGTRQALGYRIEHRNAERRLQTMVGEVSYRRTYYKKASGGYSYLADAALGVEKGTRVSEGLSLALVRAATEMSYGKAGLYLTNGEISRQTVMEKVRRSSGLRNKPAEQQKVPELHIDADEAHITLRGGRKSEVPLVSVYEGIEQHGKRRKCKNIFHFSEYGKSPDELWEQVLTEVETRYDLLGTKVYIHGDGGAWIQKGLEWFPGSIFVLDKYHKNKAIKCMTAGLANETRKQFDNEIRKALSAEDTEFFEQLTISLCDQVPDRVEKILESAGYLKRFIDGISICAKDPAANNGGCTEPHVSHVLSSRLSSRPMAWSKCTLVRFAPMLACGNVCTSQSVPDSLPVPLRNAAVSANAAFRKGTTGLPNPNSIGTLPISGKVTGLQKILKHIA